MDIRAYLKDKRDLIDSFLRGYFAEAVRPEVLTESMFYSLSAGGKRIRPVLCMAAYEACGGRAEDIVGYASAIEMIHTYSLIHDDLPCMDDDDLRRGKPTNHKVYGEAIAILAGDALLTEAFSILSVPRPPVTPDRLLSVIAEISTASGMRGMVGGQVQDMLSENSGPDEETLRFIHMKKTAALLSASVTSGALLFGPDSDRLSAVSEYGLKIGLAFQVIDDILDIEGETEVLGKPKGSDEKKRKLTYPRVYGLAGSKAMAGDLIKEALAPLSDFSSEADPLREIAGFLLNRTN